MLNICTNSLCKITIYTNSLLWYIDTILEEASRFATPPRKEHVRMAVSKAQQASVNKYVKANYDRINVTLPKGQKEVVQAHASIRGESVNGFINRAIAETMDRDGEGGDAG